jgi:hypothetical protein
VVGHGPGVSGEVRKLAILEVDDAVGVLEEGGDIAGEIVGVGADTEDER